MLSPLLPHHGKASGEPIPCRRSHALSPQPACLQLRGRGGRLGWGRERRAARCLPAGHSASASSGIGSVLQASPSRGSSAGGREATSTRLGRHLEQVKASPSPRPGRAPVLRSPGRWALLQGGNCKLWNCPPPGHASPPRHTAERALGRRSSCKSPDSHVASTFQALKFPLLSGQELSSSHRTALQIAQVK